MHITSFGLEDLGALMDYLFQGCYCPHDSRDGISQPPKSPTREQSASLALVSTVIKVLLSKSLAILGILFTVCM